MFTHMGTIKHRAGNRHGEMHHPLGFYRCTDGWVCIASASYNQWEALCIAIDRVELLADDALANAAVRYDRADEIDAIISDWAKDRTVAEAMRACQDQFCPAGPVGDLPTTLASEQLAFRDYWQPLQSLGSTAKVPGAPYRVEAGSPAEARPPAPAAPGFAPLAGVRVLELTISWAGPLAARLLGKLPWIVRCRAMNRAMRILE